MEIKMPQLGESVTEGTIHKWLVKPGDPVKKYQPIAEVITDKVNAELPAPADGVMEALLINEGTTVQVGTLIARMAGAGGSLAGVGGSLAGAGGSLAGVGGSLAGAGESVAGVGGSLAGVGGSSAGVGGSLAGAGGSVAGVGGSSAGVGGSLAGAGGSSAGVSGSVAVSGTPAALAKAGTATLDRAAGRFSPAVLKLAQAHGIDLSRVQGTGLGGRITRKDLEAVIAAGGLPAAAPAGAPADPSCVGGMVAGQATTEVLVQAPAPVAKLLPTPAMGDQVIPVDPVRRAIASKMLQSKHEAPHAWTMIRADVTGLVRLKEQLGEEFRRREGVSLSYVPFFIKAVVESLKEYPIINAQWAGDQIILKKEINISVAVATETALAVPVIKNADRLSIAGLNHAVVELAAKARAGKLSLEDISGGTFTVNNTGYFGSYMSAPIINHPQAAILAFEAITKTPVVLENDAIAIRSMINLCMSLDHRVLDGLVSGRFLQAVKNRLESYAPGTVTLY
jgi:2-oxoisovalerate dehydrogenase E2 component (dihydrolipoyl transacylase)